MDRFLFKFRKKIILTAALFSMFTGVSPAIAGTVLVTNVLSNTVTLFDEQTLKVVKEIKVGFMPHEVVVAPDDHYALVSNFGDLLNLFPGDSLSVIDIANGKNVRTIQLPKKSRPHGMTFITDTEVLVTAQGIQSLLKIDFTTGTIKKTLPLPGQGAHMVIVDKARKFAYVANMDSGSVIKIDLRNFSVIGEVKIGNEAEGLALSNEEDLLWVTDRKDSIVAVIRTKDLSLQRKLKTDSGPVRVVMFDQGWSAVVINSTGGTADVIDTSSLFISKIFNTTTSSWPLPVPINVFVKPDQKTAYITNSFANNITLVNLLTGEVLKTFKNGYMPDGVAVSQVTLK